MRLCYLGHLWRSCIHDDVPVCPHCAEEAAWEHLVDETDGPGVEPDLAATWLSRPWYVTAPTVYEIPG
jgi:hypothetical protein